MAETMFHRDPRRAPDHLVERLAQLMPRPPLSPAGEPTVEQWRAQVRRWVDGCWAEAFYAGVAHMLSLERPRVVLQFGCASPQGLTVQAPPAGQACGGGTVQMTPLTLAQAAAVVGVRLAEPSVEH